MSNIIGTTRAIVRLRSGPGNQHSVVVTVGPGSQVEVLATEGDWMQVRYQGKTGYVHQYFIQTETAPSPAAEPPPASTSPPGGTQPQVDPQQVPLEPPAAQKLSVSPTAPYLERLTAEVWNKYGGILSALSKQLDIDPGVAVAVFAIESGGRGFGPDGRLLIRFENHIFFEYWGKSNPGKFNQHFRFDSNQRWTGHQFRKSPRDGWQDVHIRQQSQEWAAFELASSFSSTAARLSISMGAPQIMGFNYEIVGFKSVHEMFDTFSKGDREQIIAFFNFIKGRDNRRIDALQKKDYETFAKYYNGPGQAKKYGGLIEDVFQIYIRLRQ